MDIDSSQKIKELARKAVLRSGLLRRVADWRSRGAAILMYHSVVEDPRSQDVFLGGISHSREVFRGQMELVARRYHPVSLNHVQRFVQGKGDLPARAVVVTFDDGYADNYEMAAPILEEFGIPATFYVTVECVERRSLPWPARLRFVFRTTKKGSWAGASGKVWPLSNAVEREKALLLSCDECCQLAGTKQEKYVSQIEADLDRQAPVESGAPMMNRMMNYDQLRELATQGHMVGSHTMTHPNMAYVGLEDVRHELTESKRLLEQQLGEPVVHFSYPCPALSPHWTEQTVAASRDAGYETAVTTDGGLARTGDDALRLKRLRPTKTVEGLGWNLECALAGRTV
jgi:peptidoglycan/xylan/chitin deacetylase (PgdA/CDA1 family)